MLRRTFLVLTIVLGSTAAVRAQSRPAYFDEPAQVVTVGTPSTGEALPVIVVLPPTGGTSQAMFELLRPAIPFARYIAILPAGSPTTSDYLPAFGQFVGWLETRVLADLARVRAEHRVDEQRTYLAGFSLGGDSSWALLARHPEIFRGAVVMGSRASARPNRAALALLRTRGCRIAFGIGSSDDAARVSGAERAHAAMASASVTSVLTRYEGTHTPPDPRTLASLVQFVMTSP
jgi:pimeloyl-ACP methyl ester carboxylesterase